MEEPTDLMAGRCGVRFVPDARRPEVERLCVRPAGHAGGHPGDEPTEPGCGRLDDHRAHVWTTPHGGPYSCDGTTVTEGGWTRCPGCGTSGRPHDVDGPECRESAREKAISQEDA